MTPFRCSSFVVATLLTSAFATGCRVSGLSPSENYAGPGYYDPYAQPASSTTAAGTQPGRPNPTGVQPTTTTTTTSSSTTATTTTNPTATVLPMPETKPRTGGWTGGTASDSAPRGLVHDLSPTVGAVGTGLLIRGEGFPDDGSVTVLFQSANSATTARPIVVTPTQVEVLVPVGAESGRVIVQSSSRPLGEARFIVTGSGPLTAPVAPERGLVVQAWPLPEASTTLPEFKSLGNPLAVFASPFPAVSSSSVPALLTGAGLAATWPADRGVALRFVGTLRVPRPGSYTFDAGLTGGIRVAINGAWVVRRDSMAPVTEGTVRVDLKAGTQRILIETAHPIGQRVDFGLGWQAPGDPSLTAIPVELFTRL